MCERIRVCLAFFSGAAATRAAHARSNSQARSATLPALLDTTIVRFVRQPTIVPRLRDHAQRSKFYG